MKTRSLAPITIYPVRSPEGRGVTFSVVRGDMVAECLAFDELLGELVHLAHPDLGVGRYSRHVDVVCDGMVRRAERHRERETSGRQPGDLRLPGSV